MPAAAWCSWNISAISHTGVALVPSSRGVVVQMGTWRTLFATETRRSSRVPTSASGARRHHVGSVGKVSIASVNGPTRRADRRTARGQRVVQVMRGVSAMHNARRGNKCISAGPRCRAVELDLHRRWCGSPPVSMSTVSTTSGNLTGRQCLPGPQLTCPGDRAPARVPYM